MSHPPHRTKSNRYHTEFGIATAANDKFDSQTGTRTCACTQLHRSVDKNNINKTEEKEA